METKLQHKIDYYLDENGNMVFTEEYHLKRGFCCGSGCRHCPFKNIDPHTPQEYTSHWSDCPTNNNYDDHENEDE